MPPVERPVRSLAEPGSRIRRGAVIASMILPRIAAAEAGTVKWPVVVPSPLSCSVSEHLSWAACSSVRTSSFSWASTTRLVGFDGLDRPAGDAAELVGTEPAAFATSWLRRPGAAPRRLTVRQLTGGLHDHRRMPGRDQAGIERSAVASWPESSSRGQRDLPGRIRAGHGGGLRDPGVGVGEPGVLRGASLVCGRDHLELQRLQPRIARSTSATVGARRWTPAGSRVQPVDQSRAGPRPQPTPRPRCRGGGRGVLTWVHSFSNICSSQE